MGRNRACGPATRRAIGRPDCAAGMRRLDATLPSGPTSTGCRPCRPGPHRHHNTSRDASRDSPMSTSFIGSATTWNGGLHRRRCRSIPCCPGRQAIPRRSRRLRRIRPCRRRWSYRRWHCHAVGGRHGGRRSAATTVATVAGGAGAARATGTAVHDSRGCRHGVAAYAAAAAGPHTAARRRPDRRSFRMRSADP